MGVQNSSATRVDDEMTQSTITTTARSSPSRFRVSSVSDSSNQPGMRSTRSSGTSRRARLRPGQLDVRIQLARAPTWIILRRLHTLRHALE
jgi:hypothetical protein